MTRVDLGNSTPSLTYTLAAPSTSSLFIRRNLLNIYNTRVFYHCTSLACKLLTVPNMAQPSNTASARAPHGSGIMWQRTQPVDFKKPLVTSDLKGQSAIVTGGSSGIGIARGFWGTHCRCIAKL